VRPTSRPAQRHLRHDRDADRHRAHHRQRFAAAGFPATEVDGEYYWDGGVVSNTPLQWVLDATPRKDTLAFQIDLWSARGELPRDMVEVDTRLKDIRYSSRTRMSTDQFRQVQALRRAWPSSCLRCARSAADARAAMLAAEADDTVYNIIQLIYRARSLRGGVEGLRCSRAARWRSTGSRAITI
jgi:NTE family protein